MSDTTEVDRLKLSLALARRKYADASLEVTQLKGRVGSTSFKLSDAKKEKRSCKSEVTQFEDFLREHGLSDKEIASIKAAEPESAIIG
jgi:hypothetical protein